LLNTGCTITEILRASHIKPWHRCSNKEKLDPRNGLLTAHIDALFDCELISFGDDGAILISKRISSRERENLGLGAGLRTTLTPELKHFLSYHRQYVARDLL
jgi:putative restriction endonuclease